MQINLYEPSSTITPYFVQAPQELNIALHIGIKGIQGHRNSCYIDATVYGMFAFSDAFDTLFLESKPVDDFELKVKNTLEQKIVNPLRKLVANLLIIINHCSCTYVCRLYAE